MPVLIDLLESNGFYPRAEDLEAILRRCDHDADRGLSFDEFQEVCDGVPKAASADDNEGEAKEEVKADEKQKSWSFEEAERQEKERQARRDKEEEDWKAEMAKKDAQAAEDEKRYRELQAKREQEIKEERERREKEIEEAKKRWQEEEEKRKQEAEAARKAWEVAEAKRKAEAEEEHRKWQEAQEKRRQEIEEENRKWREEEEKRQQEVKEANAKFYEATGKLVGFLTDRITDHINHDYQKKLLSYHASFDTQALFREMDTDHDGVLTSAELQAYFANEEDFADFKFGNLVKYWSGSGEDRLSFTDFQYGLSAYPGPKPVGYTFGSRARHSDDDQKASQDKSWRSQLKLVVYLTGTYANKAAGESTEVPPPTMSHDEAADLWSDIDNYRYGWVSANAVARWLADFANFNLPGNETHFLYDCFEVSESTGRIT